MTELETLGGGDGEREREREIYIHILHILLCSLQKKYDLIKYINDKIYYG